MQQLQNTHIGRFVTVHLHRPPTPESPAPGPHDTLQGLLFAVDHDAQLAVVIQPSDGTTTVFHAAAVREIRVEEKSTNTAHAVVRQRYFCASAEQPLPSPDYDQLRARLERVTTGRALPPGGGETRNAVKGLNDQTLNPKTLSSKEPPSKGLNGCEYPIAPYELFTTLARQYGDTRWGDERDVALILQSHREHCERETGRRKGGEEIKEDIKENKSGPSPAPEITWPVLVVAEDVAVYGPWDGSAYPRVCSRSLHVPQHHVGTCEESVMEWEGYGPEIVSRMEGVARVKGAVVKWAQSTSLLRKG